MSENPPVDPNALFNHGLALHRAGEIDKAEAAYRHVLSLHPMHFDALHMLGVIALQRQEYERAVELIGMAISVDPHNPIYADAFTNRGTAYRALGKNKEAVASYTQAIKLRPNQPETYFNRANAYRALNQGPEALADLEQAARLSPNTGDAAYNRALSLSAMNRPHDAIEAFKEAIRQKPDQPYVAGLMLFEKLRICDWTTYKADVRSISESIERGERATPPYPMLTVSNSAALQRKAAEIWANDRFPPRPAALPARRGHHDRIRIGYFCEAFREHPVSYQIAPVLEAHDRRKFEIYAFSYGTHAEGDQMRQRITDAAEHFVDISAASDTEALYLARESEIDIAVDLTGHTGAARTGIFAQRAAPVQVNAIGYPGTMGADYMDYILADSTVIPEADRAHYREKIIYMPGSYNVTEVERGAASRSFTRAAVGLPRDGFVFCNLDSAQTIQPEIFASWMRILQAIPDSTLLLHSDNVSATAHLRTAAAAYGIVPDRLAFSRYMMRAQYIARFQVADLFLDTQPHNSGLSAADALAAGLPVLTCAGNTFIGRMGASRLNALGLPELVAKNLADYEEQAIALAQSPERLSALKTKLADNLATGGPFDVRRYTAALEEAYGRIHARALASMKPEHILL